MRRPIDAADWAPLEARERLNKLRGIPLQELVRVPSRLYKLVVENPEAFREAGVEVAAPGYLSDTEGWLRVLCDAGFEDDHPPVLLRVARLSPDDRRAVEVVARSCVGRLRVLDYLEACCPSPLP